MNISSKVIILIIALCAGCIDPINGHTANNSVLVDIGPCLTIKDDLIRSQCEIQAVEEACIEQAKIDCEDEDICVLTHILHCPVIQPDPTDKNHGSS